MGEYMEYLGANWFFDNGFNGSEPITEICSKSDIGALRALLSSGHGINDEFAPYANLLLHAFRKKSNNQFISCLIHNGAKFSPNAINLLYSMTLDMDQWHKTLEYPGRVLLCYKAMGCPMKEKIRYKNNYIPYVSYIKNFLSIYGKGQSLSFIPEVFGISVEEITEEELTLAHLIEDPWSFLVPTYEKLI